MNSVDIDADSHECYILFIYHNTNQKRPSINGKNALFCMNMSISFT